MFVPSDFELRLWGKSSVELEAHAHLMVARQIPQFGFVQGIEPEKPLAVGHLSELKQRAVNGIALIHGTGINDRAKAGPEFFDAGGRCRFHFACS